MRGQDLGVLGNGRRRRLAPQLAPDDGHRRQRRAKLVRGAGGERSHVQQRGVVDGFLGRALQQLLLDPESRHRTDDHPGQHRGGQREREAVADGDQVAAAGHRRPTATAARLRRWQPP
jgi:hypothetical protein